MKYKLKPENRPAKVTKELITCRPAYLSLKAKVKATHNIVSHIKLPVGICFLVNSISSLFAKVSFFIKRVLLAKVTINGMPNNTLHAITRNRSGILSTNLTKLASESPPEIPNQNTKFHNLSLLSHLSCLAWFKGLLFVATDFVKSSIVHSHLYIASHHNIIPKIRSIIKQIIITFGIIISLQLSNMAQGATRPELLEIISNAEKEHNIPKGLLLAVAKTESNLEAYALNISGRSHFFKDKDTALKTIRCALDEGITNIDIGAAQINYKWHGHKFSSIEDMLSPEVNIKYAAKLLSTLRQEYGDWHRAIRLYHSSKPKHHRQYSRKVVLCWLGV
jgi:hypothetical protein